MRCSGDNILDSGQRIFTLLEMLRFYAESHRRIASYLSAVATTCDPDVGGSALGVCTESNLEIFRTRFAEIKRACEAISLETVGYALDRFIYRLNESEPLPLDVLKGYIEDIKIRYDDDLAGRVFLHIQPRQARFYEPGEPLFGIEVAERFTSAADDIVEAGKCLALDRGTATVFHLMHVMEVGLKALAQPLGIPYAPSWESYLKQIAAQLALPWNGKTPEWKRDGEFYREAAAHLSTVKVAWRNPTMHIVKQYTTETAEEIYNSVRAFMRHLATKLSETP